MIIDLPMNEANKELFETKIDWDAEEKRLEEEEKEYKEKNNKVTEGLH